MNISHAIFSKFGFEAFQPGQVGWEIPLNGRFVDKNQFQVQLPPYNVLLKLEPVVQSSSVNKMFLEISQNHRKAPARVSFWTPGGSQKDPIKWGLSFLLSRCFLGVASLVFSKIWHGARIPCEVGCHRAGFSGKNFFAPKLGK